MGLYVLIEFFYRTSFISCHPNTKPEHYTIEAPVCQPYQPENLFKVMAPLPVLAVQFSISQKQL